jgi:hypothetical protein
MGYSRTCSSSGMSLLVHFLSVVAAHSLVVFSIRSIVLAGSLAGLHICWLPCFEDLLSTRCWHTWSGKLTHMSAKAWIQITPYVKPTSVACAARLACAESLNVRPTECAMCDTLLMFETHQSSRGVSWRPAHKRVLTAKA